MVRSTGVGFFSRQDSVQKLIEMGDGRCRRVLWLFVLSATLFVGVLQCTTKVLLDVKANASPVVTTIRLYRSWDSQIRIRYILIGAFSVCYVAAAILSIISVTLLIRAERSSLSLHFIDILMIATDIIHPTPVLGDQCATGNLPKTVPWVLGILVWRIDSTLRFVTLLIATM